VNLWLIFGLTSAVYLLINMLLPRIPLDASLKSYVLQPALWGGVTWAVSRLPPVRMNSKMRTRGAVVQLGFLIGFFQVFLYAVGGLFSKFGKSPSSFSLLGIITNIFFVGALLIGTEVSRAWLVNRIGRRHPFLALSCVTLFFTVLSIPLSQITGFKPGVEALNLVGSNWLPLLAENLLATMLAYLAGAKASLAYRGLLALFWWFCPILPDLPWALKGLIGAGVPIVGMVVANSLYAVSTIHGKRSKRARESSFPTGWIITAIVSVVFVWFGVGLFPFQPSVIVSGSMRPGIDIGDIVIVAKVPSEVIKVGDIIQYRRTATMNIMHRVIKIENTGGSKTFITKGDANDSIDEPVNPQNVVGKVVFTVPEIGWVSIFVKNLFSG
jgi:signal peptidase